MSRMARSKSGSRSSRSRTPSRSRSRSFSKSRSRSRSLSHPRKRRHSSRSRSRSYSPSHNRERNYPRVYQNRDNFRGNNRGYRRPYYFRNNRGGRGFYPRGPYNRGGYVNYNRPNWQNYNRPPYSPRRGRSRSRTPKRRSPSPRSRSHSRNSDKSSSDRSRRSSSSKSSSSNHSIVESSKRRTKKEKKAKSKDKRAALQTAGEDDSKETSLSGGGEPNSKAETSKEWHDISYDTSPIAHHSPDRAPTLKSSVQSVVVRRSPRPNPLQKSPSSPQSTALPSGSSFRAMTRQSPFDHNASGMSPPKKGLFNKTSPTISAFYGNQKDEGRTGDAGPYSKRPSGMLAHERKLSRDLVHTNKKEGADFRSIFQHIQSAQPQRSPSELFAQHIVTIVHHVKEHHFGPGGMTLNERFTKYLKKGADQEPTKTKKSPEIHRRIDISPTAFRKGFSHEEGKASKESSHKSEGKYKDEPVESERRKKHKEHKRGRSRETPDSRDSSRSRERSVEKPAKSRKGSKKHKKHRKMRERSPSPSTTASSRSRSPSTHSFRVGEEVGADSEEKDESATPFDKPRFGSKDFTSSSERGRARGNFKKNPEHEDREGENEEKWVNRGRGRGAFPRGRGRFLFRKPGNSPKWSHDKFSGEEGEIEDESGAETRDEKSNSMSAAE